MRGLLAQVLERQHKSCDVMPGVHEAAFDADEQVIAHAELPERERGLSSFEGRNARGFIFWRTAGNSAPEEAEHCLEVPKVVAKEFGESRRYSSKAKFEYDIEQLLCRAASSRALDRAAVRERCASDFRRLLREEGFPASVVDQTVDNACRNGIISDKRYAESFIAGKLRAGWGRVRIERVLAEKDIDPALCLEGYPEEYFGGLSEEDRARALLAKRSLPTKDPIKKFASFLVGRGFNAGTAFRVARQEVDARAEAQTMD